LAVVAVAVAVAVAAAAAVVMMVGLEVLKLMIIHICLSSQMLIFTCHPYF
jgi:hypothetical protein